MSPVTQRSPGAASYNRDYVASRAIIGKMAGWKGRAGSAVGCNLSRLGFLREVCAGFAAVGRLQLLSLRAGGTTFAMKCNLRSADAVFGLRNVYDERFAKGSPGVQLEIDAVGVFHASGDLLADSCTNHTENPQAWLWPDSRALRRFVVTLANN